MNIFTFLLVLNLLFPLTSYGNGLVDSNAMDLLRSYPENAEVLFIEGEPHLLLSGEPAMILMNMPPGKRLMEMLPDEDTEINVGQFSCIQQKWTNYAFIQSGRLIDYESVEFSIPKNTNIGPSERTDYFTRCLRPLNISFE